MYSAKEYSVGFVLLLCTALSSWLVLNTSPVTTTPVDQTNYPESIMTNAIITRMNSTSGLPQDQLQTPLLVHYTTGDLTKMTQPRFVFMQEAGEPWHLSADQGQANNGVDLVKLSGHVALTQAKSADNPPISITTSAVTIYPKQQFAETDQPIVAQQPDKMIQAVGMQTHFKTGTVELLSHVQGKYQHVEGAE